MTGAAQLFIEDFVGGFFAVQELNPVLTTTPQEILRNNPERVGWALFVTGATSALLAFNALPTAANSLPIAGNGGNVTVNVRDDFILPTWSLHGVVSVGTTTLHIVEIVRVNEPPA